VSGGEEMKMDDNIGDIADDSARAPLDRIGTYVFSYLLGALLLLAVIYIADFWQFLANTRLLNLLINAGSIQYHDLQPGILKGLPHPRLFMQANEPVNWLLVQLAGLIFLGFWLIKALQFHVFARFSGIDGTFTIHARAYLEGIGINRFLPFNRGFRSISAAMERQGATAEKVSIVMFLMEIFVIFEIAVFSLIGLYYLGWSVWIAQMFWPLLILFLCYLFVRPGKALRRQTVLQGSWRDAVTSIRALSQQPITITKVAIFSLLAFGLEDIAAYMIAMAFTTPAVNIQVAFPVLLMAIVGSYIARLIPVTPGGIGQFEWGFAAALWVAGYNLDTCVTVAILDNAVRYAYGTFLLLWVYILRVDYSWEVLKRFGKVPSAGA